MIDVLVDMKGWNIDIRLLPSPQREKPPFVCCYDQIFESNNCETSCLFYTIFEYRPGLHAGLIAVHKDKSMPRLVVNPRNTWFEFNCFNSVAFSDSGRFLFLRKTCYNINLSNPDIPFCIIDTDRLVFTFFEFDFTSRFYTVRHVFDTVFELVLAHPDDLNGTGKKTRAGEIIDLKEQPWFRISEIHNFCSIYWNNI